jgi:hypothetical protein
MQMCKSDRTPRIHRSTEYDRFLSPGWQRDVSENRAKKMADLNDEQGFDLMRFNPVIVQPDGEGGYIVVDGQHRVKAAEISGDPIYYVIDDTKHLDPGIISELNQFQKDWGLRDWVEYYAHFGIEDYQYLLDFISNRYPCAGVRCAKSIHTGHAGVKKLQRGDLSICEESRDYAENLFDAWGHLSDVSGIDHTRQTNIHAFNECWEADNWETERFIQRIKDYGPPAKRGRKNEQAEQFVKKHNYQTNGANSVNLFDVVNPEHLSNY